MSFTPGEPDPPDGPGRFGCHTDAEIREKLVSPDKNARGTWMVRLHGREESYAHRVGGTSEMYVVVENATDHFHLHDSRNKLKKMVGHLRQSGELRAREQETRGR